MLTAAHRAFYPVVPATEHQRLHSCYTPENSHFNCLE